jgi:putative ABC transport system substrate-binding protein
MNVLRLLVALTLSLPVVPFVAVAQQPGKGYRIGILAGNSHVPREQYAHKALQQGLHELGYVEGQNVMLDYRPRSPRRPSCLDDDRENT